MSTPTANPSQTSNNSSTPSSDLDAIHHIAISVKDIAEAVDWYTKTFRCKIAHQDDTWAMLTFANIHLALVLPHQHPPHIGFTHPQAEQFGTLKTHRDGSRSTYIPDCAGNAVEILDANSV
ncbi:VOC family protein [bacterium]|nr:VOC family protein [bacterium]